MRDDTWKSMFHNTTQIYWNIELYLYLSLGGSPKWVQQYQIKTTLKLVESIKWYFNTFDIFHRLEEITINNKNHHLIVLTSINEYIYSDNIIYIWDNDYKVKFY